MLAAEASAAEDLRSFLNMESIQQQHDNRNGVLTAISRALRTFGELPLEGTGALAQAWMPVSTPEGSGTVLQTKGLPYCLIGPGDMLALFRCLSCKYSFSSDLKQLALMGAPGRVFTSGEAETSDNVQQCNVSIYLRVRDAQACRVSSTVLLPVFAEPSRKNAVAVLEVTQFNGAGVSYQTVFEWARTHLEAAGLFTPKQLETRTFEMQSHALSIRFFSSRDSALGCIFNDEGEAGGGRRRPGDVVSASHQQQIEGQGHQGETTKEMKGNNSNSGDQNSSGGESEDEGNEDESGQDAQKAQAEAEDEQWEPKSGSGAQNKAGLTREDLEKQFGLGLKEAAVQLGVCNTTLKRACRRHGIMKWPRRELLRAAKAQKEAAKKSQTNNAGSVHEPPLRLRPVPGGHLTLGTQATGSLADSSSLSSIFAKDRQLEWQQGHLAGLPHAASSGYMPPIPSSPSLSQHQGTPGTQPPRAVISQEDAGAFPPLPAEGIHDFGRWQAPSQAVNDRLAGPACIADNGGSRRSSLGFIDAMFGSESEPSGLGSILREEWEQELSTLRQAGGVQAMEVVSEADEGGPAADAEMSDTRHLKRFPDVPEPWQLEQGQQHTFLGVLRAAAGL